MLTFLETTWATVPLAAITAKVFLWSSCRKLEVASLTWAEERIVGEERHFRVVGKWGVERWFRLPTGVYADLLRHKTASPFVFDAYIDQLHAPSMASSVANGLRTAFSPDNFGRWFYDRIKEWAASNGGEDAYVHVFRKTTLQHARRGEDINRQVANDARVSEHVMMTNYVTEDDEALRQRSNRTYRRIAASLPPEVASRYGFAAPALSDLETALQAAIEAKDWIRASDLAARLAKAGRPDAE